MFGDYGRQGGFGCAFDAEILEQGAVNIVSFFVFCLCAVKTSACGNEQRSYQTQTSKYNELKIECRSSSYLDESSAPILRFN